MNDCYAGDIGDFCKYGLLRSILNASNGKNLGINWYRTDSEKKGTHYAYLELNNKRGQTLRKLDEILYASLSPFSNPECRKISNVEEKNILPVKTITFNDFVPERYERESWHKRALQHLIKADIVFLDPDNGIEIPSNPYSREHVRIAELMGYYMANKSVVFYAHRPHEDKTKFNKRFSILDGKFPKSITRRIRSSLGGQRDYCFIIRSEHVVINKQLNTFLDKWNPHFIEVTEND